MIARSKKLIIGLVLKDRSARKLAIAFSVGTYIAFCPFIGLHTIMCIAAAWLFRLNPTMVVGSAYLVNNPWTLVPVYSSGYLCGYWLLHGLIKCDTSQLNPAFMSHINEFLHTHVGIGDVCLWSFMLGGNLLGVALAVMIYPVAKAFFTRIIADDAARPVPELTPDGVVAAGTLVARQQDAHREL